MPLSTLILIAAIPQAQVDLDLPAGLPQTVYIDLEFRGKRTSLNLKRRSLRAESFQLWNSDGEIKEIPPSRTYFGSASNLPGWNVAASLEEGGLRATLINPSGEKWRLAPTTGSRIRHTISKATPPPIAKCGVDDSHEIPLDKSFPNSTGRAWGVTPPANGNPFPSPHPWNWKLRKSRIAFDATYDYWLREGQTVAGVTAGVEYQLAENDICYARDSLATYELTGIVIRQSRYYTNIGYSSGVLLGDFGVEWDNNQQHIPRESAVLLSDYQNDGIAGLAWVGTLGGGLAYAGLFWDRGYSPGIIAHEVGHNWGAGHIDCWPWGGSAMCGAWLLLGPDTTNIIIDRADWLNLPEVPRFVDAVRPYADPDWADGDSQGEIAIDVLDNDYDANFDRLNVSGVDPISTEGGNVSVLIGAGPGGRDLLDYHPDRTRVGSYTDTFWYAAGDNSGLEHWTPVTVDVTEKQHVLSWKFEEGGGNSLIDSSGTGNDANALGPQIRAERNDPTVVLECTSNGWTPSNNLWDNDANTDFASANQGVVSANFTRDPADGTWLEFDFGAPISIDGFRHQDRSPSNEWIAKSQLWLSQDNVFDANDQLIEIIHSNHGDFVEYPFEPIVAQFVRWEVTEQYDQSSSLHSLGAKEISFLYDAQLAELSTPSVLLSSNAQSGKGADNLVDGDSVSEFVSPGQGVCSTALTRNSNDGTWAEFDFQQTLSFEGARFLDRDIITTWTGQSRLWFSTTSNFSTSDPVFVWNHGNQDFAQVLDFPMVNARYVRWEVSGKTPLTWFPDMGGRELTLFTDAANFNGFQRVAGPNGDCLQISKRLAGVVEDANSVPSASNAPFTINLFVNPNGALADGTMLAGFGDAGINDGRYFEIIAGRLHFAGIDSGWTLPSTSWSMLTASFNGSELSLYQDAQLIGSWPLSLGACSNTLQIVPINLSSPDQFFTGLLDEFDVWDYQLNEIEIDELLIGGPASGPTPFDTRTMVSTSPRLSWAAARNNPQHDVFLTTDFASARDALAGSPDHYGRFSSAHVDLQNLNPRTWYFWRVDEVYANGDVVPGKVWRFKTELPWTTTAVEAFADGNDGDHLNGLAGGTGFAAAWEVPTGNGYKHRLGSIGAYPSNLPLVEVDGYFERKTVSNLSMEGQRNFDNNAIDIDLAGDGSFYISFAMRLSGSDSEMTAMCGLRNSSNGDTIVAGAEGGAWAIDGAAGSSSGVAASKSRTQFVVLRIDASGKNPDQVWMKIYDSALELVHQSDTQLNGVGTGADQWDYLSSGADASGTFDQLFIRAGGIKTFSTSIVEIRVGRIWSDITGL